MKTKLFLLISILVLVLAACQSTTQVTETPQNELIEVPPIEEKAIVPSVSVIDQELTTNTVTIDEVVSDSPGWLVIHAQADGKPGPILGFTAVAEGVNKNVVVEINTDMATETLYAMLHSDAGEVGTFEFPDGPDGPVKVNEKVVTPPFNVGLPMASGVMISTANNNELGTFLADENGFTLYVFEKDVPGMSNCYDACATKWPPLLTEGEPIAGEGINATLLGTTERTDGTLQVTYNGWPLYYWVDDAVAGETNGQGANNVWFVIAPDGEMTRPSTGTKVSVTENEALGSFLVDDNGMTLYLFLKDTPGTSNCYDACATNWPPLLTEGEPVAAEAADADLLGTTERSDGTIQVTYNGWPLYYWVDDAMAGETNGQGVNDVWFVIDPDGMSVQPAVSSEISVSNNANLGALLVDGSGLTLYIFLKDTPDTSNCYDVCATNWPPLITESEPVAGEGVDVALLGITERTDGSLQVTYNGWPLYYWKDDTAPGETLGQGVGEVWYVIDPAGMSVQ